MAHDLGLENREWHTCSARPSAGPIGAGRDSSTRRAHRDEDGDRKKANGSGGDVEILDIVPIGES